MDITLKDKNGVTLHTAKKHCKEDITVRVDTQEIEITPSATEQVEEGLFNKVTVQGDANLVPENIKIGTNIFGVEGGFDAVDTRDADAIASDITKGKTAYVNNQKVTGTMETTSKYNAEINTYISSGTSEGSSINSAITKINAEITVNGTSAQYMFFGCSSLEAIPFIDLSAVTNISYMFQMCKSIKTIPKFNTSNVRDALSTFLNCTNLEEIPQIDISKVTRSGMMFANCTNLKTIPPLTIGASNMTNMFSGCPNLSDESLNNILLMCANSGVGNVTMKKLSYIGLTSAQATVCQGLSNYQAFLDAGWTTGY